MYSAYFRHSRPAHGLVFWALVLGDSIPVSSGRFSTCTGGTVVEVIVISLLGSGGVSTDVWVSCMEGMILGIPKTALNVRLASIDVSSYLLPWNTSRYHER